MSRNEAPQLGFKRNTERPLFIRSLKAAVFRPRMYKGFTLIELMVSSGILAIVGILIYASFHTGSLGYKRIEQNIKEYHTARIFFQKFSRELKNSACFSKADSGLKGQKDQIYFNTILDRDYCLVSYKQEAGKLLRSCLKNSKIRKSDPAPKPEIYFFPIEEINFFYAKISEENLLEWKDSWNEPGFPAAIRISLETQGKKIERLITLPLYAKK